MKAEILKKAVLALPNEDFESVAMDIFRYQVVENPLFGRYARLLGRSQAKNLAEIPFLPIEFFKQHTVQSGQLPPQATFESSGTTGQQTSRHHVADLAFYETLSEQIFTRYYDSLEGYHVLALLPSYLERTNSSLVYMVQHFIQKSASPLSGFYLYDHTQLLDTLRQAARQADRKVLLLGVTFALLDLAESGLDLSIFKEIDVVVMETGGMKGRRQEWLREEVHALLTERLHQPSIHSEYGMTELLSQAYSAGEGVFVCPPSMRVLLREVNDPLSAQTQLYRTGGLNICDLANVDSCSFVQTQDLGWLLPEGRFKVLGRFDNADLRGCNLLIN
jgi:hypothetical protein